MTIEVSVEINAPAPTVWNHWTAPASIVQWNFASEDWCCPHASNDVQVGGKFSWRMEAVDGSMGFDFEGQYTEVILHDRLTYQIADGREVSIQFMQTPTGTQVIERFEAENENSADAQRAGWQAILDRFKHVVEAQ